MVQVTVVESPLGSIANSAVFWPSNGLMKSSLMVIFDGCDASMISIRPSPTLLLPCQAYAAPLPAAGPLKVRFMSGSIFSHGDHDPQRWKSLTRGKIFSGGALMLVERWTLKLSGLVAAKMRI